MLAMSVWAREYSFCSASDQQVLGCAPFTAGQMDRTALALFNSPALPGEPGKWLIPNDSGVSPTPTHPYNAFLPGTGRFKADLAVAMCPSAETTLTTSHLCVSRLFCLLPPDHPLREASVVTPHALRDQPRRDVEWPSHEPAIRESKRAWLRNHRPRAPDLQPCPLPGRGRSA